MSRFSLSIRNIRRHWRYSFGAFLSVGTGFVALCLFQAYIEDVDQLYQDTYEHRNMYGDLIVERDLSPSEKRAEPWASKLSQEQQDFIEQKIEAFDAEYKVAVPFLMASGSISNSAASSAFFAKAYSVPEGTRVRGAKWEWDTAAGIPLSKAPNEDAIVIGRGLAESLGCRVPRNRRLISEFRRDRSRGTFECPETRVQLEATTESGQSNAIEGEIVGIVDGIFKELDERYLMLPIGRMKSLFDTSKVSFVALDLDSPATARRFLDEFNADSGARELGLRALSWQDSEDGDMYRRTLDLLIVFRNFVVSIMIVITGLSVFNTFLKAVKERTREIGTMRSLGFRRGQVLALFFYEALLLSLLGVVGGGVFAAVATIVINSVGLLYKAGLLSEPVPSRLAFVPYLYVLSAVFLVSVAVVASLSAAWRTVTRRVAENLATS